MKRGRVCLFVFCGWFKSKMGIPGIVQVLSSLLPISLRFLFHLSTARTDRALHHKLDSSCLQTYPLVPHFPDFLLMAWLIDATDSPCNAGHPYGRPEGQ